jgi:hypothetical protein
VDVLLVLGLEYRSGSFIFLVSFFIFWLGASILPLGYCIVAETGCNWYVSILIYSLFRKNKELRMFLATPLKTKPKLLINAW